MLVLDEYLMKLNKLCTNEIPGTWGTHFWNWKNFRRGTPDITHRFAKFLFQLWDIITYLYLEICRTDFPKTLPFYFTQVGVFVNKVWKKSNSVFWRKPKICEKNTVFGSFSRKFHFLQKNWIKIFWNFFCRFFGSR